MGWDFTKGATKADIVRSRTNTFHGDNGTYLKTIKHKVVGNALYSLVEEVSKPGQEPIRFIMVNLLENQKGYGWGYKDMSEMEGPYANECRRS